MYLHPSLHGDGMEAHVATCVWGEDSTNGCGVCVGLGERAVYAARAVVIKNVEPWTVVGGNPARFIRKRVLNYE